MSAATVATAVRERPRLTHEEWRAAAVARYGEKVREWRFRCPVCGHVATVQDWLDLKADDAIAFSCVGRWMPAARNAFEGKGAGPCNYAGGGLFRLNPITVVRADAVEIESFDFADQPLSPPPARVVHCKRDRYDIYIGRACYGMPASKWGNPFKVPKGYDVVADPDAILARYEAHVRGRPDLMAALPELRGKVLGCWCAPKPCHGDVLLRMAGES